MTIAPGFRAAGVAAGIRSGSGPDVALVVNDGPGEAAAGVFTRNRFAAAPVLWSRQVLTDGQLRAVVLNAGGANACTGPEGFQDTHATAEHVARLLGCGAGEVAVCSTGLIGVRLPLPRLLDGVTAAAGQLRPDGGDDAARAVLTTDTVPKQAVHDTGTWRVAGFAKGAGMLAPELATMLVVLTTDAVADAAAVDAALRSATGVTFDRLDSDGCMSTNDTVLLLASGASGVPPGPGQLAGAVSAVCADLARQLLADAEGATKDIRVDVTGAVDEAEALLVARTVARSNLFKCAIHGQDPNWGRVLSAVGTTDAVFDPARVDVTINGVTVARGGAAGDDRALVDLSGRDVVVGISLGAGSSAATVWTSDLTAAYVHENSAYST
ncbi:MAG TPA: bifunctional glutamate N-acetyltransferase/amino-acid acetyltransferase ArgJ [Actinomycetes bacterium]|nr:bifunctional glutamate N-acetyltransferase/amino-acid acetyltransferase ArgJ [Actinomycetes bacterium]